MADRKMGRPTRAQDSLAEQPCPSSVRRLAVLPQAGPFSRVIFLSAIFLSILPVPDHKAWAGDGNRLAYLDEVDPWAPHAGFPKLVTPQWVGEEGVEAVVVLAIDDMRDPAKYEQYLRPILNRLKAIDGRAPVSIMTCSVRPDDPQLAQWLDEGLSLEVHTVDHPCPLLQGGDFAKAKSTYDRCIDLLHEIPGNRPVAFRTPCCDSLNTVSPRFFTEIFGRTTEKGHFLEVDSSVFNVFTADDPEIPRELVFDADGREKFRKYLPRGLKRGEREFNTFVNWIENYPYPYVIGNTCWEFPCMVPSDWSAQHLHGVNNPDTVRDWKAALDITVLKQGVFCVVFHPHGWIRPEQVVELIDHAVARHGRKVKFLTFREALERLNKNMLVGNPLRTQRGEDNLIRVLDIDDSGHVDVLIRGKIGPDGISANDTLRWWPGEGEWWPLTIPDLPPPRNGKTSLRFGVLHKFGRAASFWEAVHFVDYRPLQHPRWEPAPHLDEALEKATRLLPASKQGDTEGLLLRDLDRDGFTEVLISRGEAQQILRFDPKTERWSPLPFRLPEGTALASAKGHDAGLRFVDADEEGHADIVFSNHDRYSVHLWQDMQTGWSRKILDHKRGDPDAKIVLPPIVREDGTNNGFFVHSRHLFWQNEDTADELDLIYRVSFDELLKDVRPGPKTPEASLKCMQVPPGFEVELVAAEPLVMDPVAFEWGADGRLWVAEMGDYPLGAEADERTGKMDRAADIGSEFAHRRPRAGGGLTEQLARRTMQDPPPPALCRWGDDCTAQAASGSVVLPPAPGRWRETQLTTLLASRSVVRPPGQARWSGPADEHRAELPRAVAADSRSGNTPAGGRKK